MRFGAISPVCNYCMLLCKEHKVYKNHPWVCIRCGNFNTNYTISDYTTNTQYLIRLRTSIYESKKSVKDSMENVFIIKKPFMIPGDPREPNDKYRPWLEKYVGMQGIDWNWELTKDDLYSIDVEFTSSEHAMLFNLTFE